ncbi:Kinase-like protein [Mycena sanguinolenta]|uniref:Kinase-like protein n=1 Tax=Mycena sanguinolenta TaxID=230812 RepID=A0A8H6Y7D8_9AGAR|nr:Kinase-like protein [Mycena sanguinolenta]
MDLQPHAEPEYTVVSTTNNANSAAYTGAFFPQATGFNICGGVFTSNVTNNVYNPPPEQPSGNINLIKEFKEMRSSPQSSLVDRQTPGASVRRVYMAKLEGRQSGHMTVVMYEGDGAQEAWNQDLANYETVRRPNIIQLYGLVNTRRLRGMVFHDGPDPRLSDIDFSLILSTYIIGYCIIETTEFEEAASYILDVFRKPPIDFTNPPIWIRPATGELCLDLALGGPGKSVELPRWWDTSVLRLENVTVDAPDSEDIIISSLGEAQFHQLCSELPIAQPQDLQSSTEHPAGPGIFRSDSQCGTWLRVTESLILPEKEIDWNDPYGKAPGELLPNSYDSGRADTLQLELRLSFWAHGIAKAWLAQANSIFAELEEEADIEVYVCVDELQFILRIADTRHVPEGYLFVCPPQDFHTGIEPQVHLYQWPVCPAYWSLDSTGADRLSTEDARMLGFPAIHIETTMFGYSWNRGVYNGLRRFHQGKGFDPFSREVARQLGYPLYEVLSDRVPFPARKGLCNFQDPEHCRELDHFL